MTLDKDWVLVPREPTEAMLEAGRRVDWETLAIGTGATSDKPLDPNYIQRAVWSAMLAAAPLPVITDEMVERATDALHRRRYARIKALFETKGASLETDQGDMRDDARACLEAALRPGGGE